MYTYTVPIFIKILSGLKNVLAKAQAFAKEKGMSEEEFLADRIAPDMFPLAKQVQLASDHAKNGTARLTGTEAPKFEDTEKTFDELLTRIDKTLAYLASVPEAAFQGAEERQVTLHYMPGKYVRGFDYAREYALPNFFFHAVTAYDLVRKNGVPIGKGDYVNNVSFKDL